MQLTWSGGLVGRLKDWQPVTGLPSSVNETVPVGVPLRGVTNERVAVSVTGWPGSGLVDDGVMVRLVWSGWTAWVKTGDVLEPKVTSPP